MLARYRELERPIDEAVALDLHARALGELGRPAECLEPAERALQLRRAALAPDDTPIARSLKVLARCQLDSGRLDDALRSIDRAVAVLGDRPAGLELMAELADLRALAAARAKAQQQAAP